MGVWASGGFYLLSVPWGSSAPLPAWFLFCSNVANRFRGVFPAGALFSMLPLVSGVLAGGELSVRGLFWPEEEYSCSKSSSETLESAGEHQGILYC